MYLDTKLPDYSHWKLSDLDWVILEGLETVLIVSHLIHPQTGAHMPTGSSQVSTIHVVRIHTSFVACDLQFRDVYDRMGKGRGTTRGPPALDGNRLAVGEGILQTNGWYRRVYHHYV